MRRFFSDPPALWLAVALAAMILIEALFARHYAPVFPWHYVPGYAGLIGLVGCILVVLASKWLGKTFLQRPATTDDE